MDSQCNITFTGSRAAREHELVEKRLLGLPAMPKNYSYEGLYAAFACEVESDCFIEQKWSKSVSMMAVKWPNASNQFVENWFSPQALVCVHQGNATVLPAAVNYSFVGYKALQQNAAFLAQLADPTAYMDAQCNITFTGSRAAREHELVEKRLLGLPAMPQSFSYEGLYAAFACEIAWRCWAQVLGNGDKLYWFKSVSMTATEWPSASDYAVSTEYGLNRVDPAARRRRQWRLWPTAGAEEPDSRVFHANHYSPQALVCVHQGNATVLPAAVNYSFVGYKALQQNGSFLAQLADPTAYMDAQCSVTFTGSRAATDSDLLGKVLFGMPTLPMDPTAMFGPVGHEWAFGCQLPSRCQGTLPTYQWLKSTPITTAVPSWPTTSAAFSAHSGPQALVCGKFSVKS